MGTPYPSRKRLDHRGPLSIGTTDAVYFITIAAAERGTAELSDKAGTILSAARHYQSIEKWFLRLFLIMPDHIHMLVHVPTIELSNGNGVPGGHALPSPAATVGRDVLTAERSETAEGRAPQPPQNGNSFETGCGVPGGHALPPPNVPATPHPLNPSIPVGRNVPDAPDIADSATVGRGVLDAPQSPQNGNSFESGCGEPGGHALPPPNVPATPHPLNPSIPVGRGVPDAPKPPRGLAKTIGDFKSFLSKKHGIRFQANFFDTRIRDQAHFAEKWNYICQNPVAKGLVPTAREWPHSIAFDPTTGRERPHR